MATLGGDLLKILAHTALQTGANVGVDYFKKDWAQQGELKNWIAKQLYESAPFAPDADQLVIQQKIKEAAGGFETPMTEKLKLIAGATPFAKPTDVLAQGKGPTGLPLSWRPESAELAEVPGGITPDVIRRLVAPIPKLETQAAAETLQRGYSPLGSLKGLKRAEVKPTDMQRYIQAVQDGDTVTVKAIEDYFGGKDAMSRMYRLYQTDPQGVTSFMNTYKPSDLTRTVTMPPEVATEVGKKRTAMEPQVPILGEGGKPTGVVVPKGAIKLETPLKKEPSVTEQIETVDKQISNLTQTLSKTYVASAKKEIAARIMQLHQQRTELQSLRTNKGNTLLKQIEDEMRRRKENP